MKMKFIKMLMLIIVLILLIPANIKAEDDVKNYFISPSGNDKNKGTEESPFKTIKKGIRVVKPGGTLYLMAGTYNEKVNVTKSGMDGKLITIKNYQGQEVFIDGKNKNGVGINIENKSYIRIEGLRICNFKGNNTPIGVSVEGTGSFIEIVNNKIYNIESKRNAHGIAFYGTNSKKAYSDILIEGNEVYNLKLGRSEAVVLNGNIDGFKIINNIIHDNNNIGIDCIGHEKTAKKFDQARNGIVISNIIYNINSIENPEYRGESSAGGIYVDGGRDINIEKNKIYDCDIGVEVACEAKNKTTDVVFVKSNLIFGCTYGLVVGGEDKANGYANNCYFLNNTLFDNETGIDIQKTKVNYFRNNIIQGGILLLDGNPGKNVLRYNLWYSEVDDEFEIPDNDVDSKFTEAKFNDKNIRDFSLSDNSPAIDMGTPDYLGGIDETDFAKNPRIFNNRVDCGAFEYIGDNMNSSSVDALKLSNSNTRRKNADTIINYIQGNFYGYLLAIISTGVIIFYLLRYAKNKDITNER